MIQIGADCFQVKQTSFLMPAVKDGTFVASLSGK